MLKSKIPATRREGKHQEGHKSNRSTYREEGGIGGQGKFDAVVIEEGIPALGGWSHPFGSSWRGSARCPPAPACSSQLVLMHTASLELGLLLQLPPGRSREQSVGRQQRHERPR